MNNWTNICNINDIVPDMGRCALHQDQQIAIFRVRDREQGEEKLFAVSNYCPFSETNIISRGIVGSLNEKIVVASPIYKQHFDLATGQCLEDESVFLPVYDVRLDGDTVQLPAEEVTK